MQRSLKQVSEEAQQVLQVVGALAYAPFHQETLENVLHMAPQPGLLSRLRDRLLRKNHTPALDVRAALFELVSYRLLNRPV
ncbi:hypothetical protein U27_05402 [Candidatus Vecturithrix granuli]|uniref:Uncharacterized protein n=1 Tax=Vecturithrix granuli TaxID=1499967 RepID=A0A081C1H3_VECG1|nr:hypothetical protein U27_05402 [Candidatus Vecturithrix granuli]